jgi:hypothetical protein
LNHVAVLAEEAEIAETDRRSACRGAKIAEAMPVGRAARGPD